MIDQARAASVVRECVPMIRADLLGRHAGTVLAYLVCQRFGHAPEGMLLRRGVVGRCARCTARLQERRREATGSNRTMGSP